MKARVVPIALRRLQKAHGLTVRGMAGMLAINRVSFSHVINGNSARSRLPWHCELRRLSASMPAFC